MRFGHLLVMSRRRAWLACFFACSGCAAKHPPPVPEFQPSQGGSDSGGFMLPPPGPPPDDAGNFCGRLFIPVIVNRPNLYFVVDASGSMMSEMDKPNSDGVIPTRYDAAVASIRELLLSVGHRVSYGAALFPAVDLNGGGPACPPGEEVFPTQPGDDVSYRISGRVGPVLNKLMATLRGRAPSGLTPTAATLRELEPKLTSLSGKTYVFLLTDGAPNCNAATACSADQCTINIEGGCDSADLAVNCCDPRFGQGYLYCTDSDPTIAAVAELAKQRVPTFVIGMPGTVVYRDLLDALAHAGGTEQVTEPYYYPVDSTDVLTQTLEKIALAVTIDCHVTLSTPPPDPKLVNVYFDKRVVKQNAVDGWTWSSVDGGAPADSGLDARPDGGSPTRIDIVGEACDELKRGDVIELQVVAGCPTVLK
jgi:hypothetical protein